MIGIPTPYKIGAVIVLTLAWTVASGYVGWHLSGAIQTRHQLKQVSDQLEHQQQMDKAATVKYQQQIADLQHRLAQQQADSATYQQQNLSIAQWQHDFQGVLDHAPMDYHVARLNPGFSRLYDAAAQGVSSSNPAGAATSHPSGVHATRDPGHAGASAHATH
jgi:TolA-binding protein